MGPFYLPSREITPIKRIILESKPEMSKCCIASPIKLNQYHLKDGIMGALLLSIIHIAIIFKNEHHR